MSTKTPAAYRCSGCICVRCAELPFNIIIHIRQILDGLYIICDIRITMNRVLDDRGGHGEVDEVHGLVAPDHGVDQTGGKGIAAAHTVEDLEGEELGFISMASSYLL